MKKKIDHYLIPVIFGLILGGCCFSSSTIKIDPDSLPIAKVGQPYYAQITTDVAMLNFLPTKSHDNKFDVKFKNNKIGVGTIELPNNIIIKIIYRSYSNDNVNRVEISGVPSTSGEYTLYIEGSNYGNMYCAGEKLKKTYVLKIED